MAIDLHLVLICERTIRISDFGQRNAFYPFPHCFKKFSLNTYYRPGVLKALTEFQFQGHGSKKQNCPHDSSGMISRENLQAALNDQAWYFEDIAYFFSSQTLRPGSSMSFARLGLLSWF